MEPGACERSRLYLYPEEEVVVTDKERDLKVVALWEDGHTPKAIAAETNIGYKAMQGIIFRLQRRGMISPRPARVKIEDNEKANTREITSKSVVIKTLDELLTFCKVDPTVWRVDRHVVNFWGNSENPNTQIKAWLERIEPVASRPVVAPVRVNIGKVKAGAVTERRIGQFARAVFWPDMHFGFSRSLRTGILTPYHDREALGVALAYTATVQPDEVVLLGDVFDLADWSDKFQRTPNMYWTTQPAIMEATWWLGQLRRVCPKAKITILEGNHDERMRRAIVADMSEAYGLRKQGATYPALSVPGMMGLEEMGIGWVGDYPDGEYRLDTHLVAMHGVNTKSKSGATVGELAEKREESIVIGHIHRIEKATRTVYFNSFPRYVTAMSPGCLCRIDGAVPGVQKKQNWQQGIGEAWWNEDQANVHLEAHAIHEGKIFLSTGDVLCAADGLLKQMHKDIEWAGL